MIILIAVLLVLLTLLNLSSAHQLVAKIHPSINDEELGGVAASYVPQSTSLISGTIKDNIVYGLTQPYPSLEKIKQVLSICSLEDYINSLPEGLQTKVSSSSKIMSGGQIQRIGIARALLQGKPLLILDEATSALDIKTEAQILKSLSLIPSLTIISVAHRQSALSLADSIVNFSGEL